MCIAFLAVDAHPDYSLLVLANRDELFARPTAAMHRWEGDPAIFAGQDLAGGGTWFGVSEAGHCALLTNYREPPEPTQGGRPSRGVLVSGYLRREEPDFELYLERQGDRFAGFNIIFGPFHDLRHFSNRGSGFTRLTRGVHGLSNALLDTPWPKVVRGKALLEEALSSDISTTRLFEILDDSLPAPVDRLPRTGLSQDLEQRLSSIKLSADGAYGSRCATVLMVHRGGTAYLWEKPYDGGPTRSFVLPAGGASAQSPG